jgi:hypothetical protein
MEGTKEKAALTGKEVSKVLEEAISEELAENSLDVAISALVQSEDIEMEFELVEAKAPVSKLVRLMRDREQMI